MPPGVLHKLVFLEVVAHQIIQFLPIFGLLIVVDAQSFELVVLHVLLVCVLNQIFELGGPVHGLQQFYLETGCVLEVLAVLTVHVEDHGQGVFVLTSVEEYIAPF
jgi:hypothetical protein